jgi:hypothetical protein
MSYFTVSLKIKHALKAQDKEEAVEAFFGELQELYDSGELNGKLKVVKTNKYSFDEDDEESIDDED